jgi:Asp-tRNA(Asn)/Glu-tRNA(Gln) amidotransferase C subunit
MKKALLVLSLCGAFAAAPVLAADKMSCDELAEVATSLAGVVSAFEKNPKLHEDKDAEKGLNQIVEALGIIAKSENDSVLSSNVKKLSKLWSMDEWKDADTTAFKDTLDSVVTNFERIHKKDCK